LSAAFRTHRDLLQDAREPRDCHELEDVVMRISNRAGECQRELVTRTDELTKLRNKLAANEALLSQEHNRLRKLQTKTESLSAKERETRTLVAQLNEIRTHKVLVGSGYEPLGANASIGELAEAVRLTEDEAKELLIIAKSGKVFLKRLKKSRQSSGGNCPCCSQNMTPGVVETYERNVKELFTFGDEAQQGTVEEHKAVAAQCTTIYNAVQDLQTALLPLLDLREDVAVAESKIADLEESSAVLRGQIASMEHDVHEKDQQASQCGKATRILSDINIRWQSVSKRQTESMDRKRRQSQSIMGNELGGRSIVDLEQLQRQRAESKDELQAKKDRLTQDDSNLTKRAFTMKNMLSEKEKALSDAKIEGNRYSETESTLNKLQTRLGDIDARKGAVTRERDAFARELSEKVLVLNTVKSALRQAEELGSGKLNAIRSDRADFLKLVESAEDVERRYGELNLAGVTENLEKANRAVNAKEDEIKTLTPRVNAINAELTSQEHTKRNVTANIELRANEIELRALQQQLATLERNSGGNAGQIKTAEREYALVDREAQTLKSERDTLRGKMEVHNQQVADLRAKLNNSTYRGIDEKHRRKNIEFETTNLAVLDLESYHNALYVYASIYCLAISYFVVHT
jgi:chromosome segregation ATPase